MRRVWLLALALAAGVGAFFTLSLIPVDSNIYDKDFGQEYLLARAIRDGVDPYQPISALAQRYVQPIGLLDKPHPTPHPPTVGLLALPLGWLSYGVAVRAWYAIELLCLLAATFLLIRGARLPWRLRLAPLLALVLVAWPPITLELGLGQLMLPLLLGLAGAQVALLSGRPSLGGALLGLTLMIKPIAWPWLIVLAWRRNWRALIATGVAGLIGGVLSVVAIGVEFTRNYVVNVLPHMSSAFFFEPTNMSLWTIPSRLGLAIPDATLGVLVLLGATCIAWRRQRLGDALGIMTVASLLASPITWYFYLSLALLPLGQVIAAVQRRGRRPVEIGAAAGVVVLLSMSQGQLLELARPGARSENLVEPTVGVGLLGILLAWLTARPWSEHRSNDGQGVKWRYGHH